MIQELEWESLADRRKTAKLCQFYFVHNGKSPNTFTKLQKSDNNNSSRHFTADVYKVIETKTVRYQKSFLDPFMTGMN